MAEPDLKRRVVLVTGAGHGIGKAIALEVARRGAWVCAADIDAAAIEAVVHTIREAATAHPSAARATGFDAIAEVLDVRDDVAFTQLVQRVVARWGRVDVLVNNAGVMAAGDFLSGNAVSDRLQLEVNVLGVTNGMRAVLPGMLAQGAGQIVNIASISSRMPLPKAAVYAATKHAVIGLTDTVRAELWASGVSFSSILPTYVATDMTLGARAPLFPPMIEPERVARALIEVLVTRKPYLYLPRYLWLFALLQLLVPTRILQWANRRLGVADSLATVRGRSLPSDGRR